MLSILILLFVIFYFILAVLRIDFAVMLLIASLPLYLIRFTVLGLPMTLLEAMILVAFAVWILGNYKDLIINLKLKITNYKLKIANRYPFDIEIILLLIISFIAVAISGFSDSALGIWKAYFFEPALVFILVLNVFGKFSVGIRHALFLRKILWPLAISALVVSVLAIYQKFTGAWIFNDFWANELTRRVTSFFGYPNAVGLYLGPLVLILTGWLAKQITNYLSRFAGSPRWSYGEAGKAGKLQITNSKFQMIKIIFIGLVIILSLFSIYFAKSEGALIGVLAGFIIFSLLINKKVRWITIVLVVIIGLGISLHQPMRDYAVKKITLQDLSGEIRKQQWRETWQTMTASPIRFIFGTGLANYKSAIEPYHQEGIFFNKENDPDFRRKIVIFDEKYKAEHWQPVEMYLYPHNILFNFWTELGLAGALLFIWIIGKYFVIGVSCRAPDNRHRYLILGLIGAMVVIVVHGLVDVPYFKNDLAIMFWILIAMMGIINLRCFKKND